MKFGIGDSCIAMEECATFVLTDAGNCRVDDDDGWIDPHYYGHGGVRTQ